LPFCLRRRDRVGATHGVSVEEAEALFDVAKDPAGHLSCRWANREVVALGTMFSVRLTPTEVMGSDALDVTLIEGQVSVRAASGDGDKATRRRRRVLFSRSMGIDCVSASQSAKPPRDRSA
jgi:ferric-dicitrate binding protein FerR (iron transport regulator)